MKHNVVLTVTSLLSLLFMTFHMTHDVIRQAEGSVLYPIPVAVFALWLYGTLMLADRVSGYIIMLLGSLIGTGIPIIHMRGVGVGFGTNRSGGFFFIWTLLAVGVTGLFSLILSVRGLWSLRRSQPQ